MIISVQGIVGCAEIILYRIFKSCIMWLFIVYITGGLFRKVFYSSVLMAGTASLCYPYQAVRIAKAEYEWVNSKIGIDDFVQQVCVAY